MTADVGQGRIWRCRRCGLVHHSARLLEPPREWGSVTGDSGADRHLCPSCLRDVRAAIDNHREKG